MSLVYLISLYFLQNTSLTWDGPWPQFTDCFQQTVMTWIPCGYLWLAAPFYTVYLAQICATSIHISGLFLAKMVVFFHKTFCYRRHVLFFFSSFIFFSKRKCILPCVIKGVKVFIKRFVKKKIHPA